MIKLINPATGFPSFVHPSRLDEYKARGFIEAPAPTLPAPEKPKPKPPAKKPAAAKKK